MSIRDELSALIARPDDTDVWAVEANQGHIRRAIMEIDRLTSKLGTAAQIAAVFKNEAENLQSRLDAAYESLKRANASAEKFEREWYLRGDELEAAQSRLEALLETRSSLLELVCLKRHKEAVGKDDYYIEAQPKAWARAHAALNAVAIQERGVERRAPLSEAPCDVCGYNGPGYYQPDTHPCAGRLPSE